MTRTRTPTSTATLTATPSATATSTPTPDAFRITSLTLVDPHYFIPSFGCFDGTDAVFNNAMATSMTSDGDSDGKLDRSMLLVFRPLDQTGGASGTMDFVDRASCTAPGGTPCDGNSGLIYSMTYHTNASGVCLAPLAGTTSGYGTPNQPTNNCFYTDPSTISWDLFSPGSYMAFYNTAFGGVYSGNPATGIVTGLMRAFMRETDADATDLAPPLSGKFSSILKGGTGNTCGGNDKDTGPGGVSGWWFYFNFTATRVTYTGP